MANIILVVVLIVVAAIALVRIRNRKVSAAAIAEWVVLLAVMLVLGYYFLRSNGFISTNDIQPYPY